MSILMFLESELSSLSDVFCRSAYSLLTLYACAESLIEIRETVKPNQSSMSRTAIREKFKAVKPNQPSMSCTAIRDKVKAAKPNQSSMLQLMFYLFFELPSHTDPVYNILSKTCTST